MDTQMTREFMQNIVRQIVVLNLDEMNAACEEARQSRQQWDSIGSLLDPTRYRDMLYDGTLDHADLQTEIVKHLIRIRELIDKMNDLTVAKQRKERG